MPQPAEDLWALPYTFMTPDEVKAKGRFIKDCDLKGALYHDTDCILTPPIVTMAMAKGGAAARV